jgi:hypothetical protein
MMFGIRIQPYGLPVLARVGWWECRAADGRLLASWRRWDGPEMRATYT